MGWSGVERAAGVRGLVWAGAAGGGERVVTAVGESSLWGSGTDALAEWYLLEVLGKTGKACGEGS